MTSSRISESTLEDTSLSWLKDLGYEVLFGPDMAFDGLFPERDLTANYTDVVLTGRLRKSLRFINPNIPDEAISKPVDIHSLLL
jgi:type I restriction enzyme R subunit